MAWNDCPMCDGVGYMAYDEQGIDEEECRYCKAYSDLQSKLAKVTKELEESKGLLKVAKCSDCDGVGYFARQVADGEWDQEQCQWCCERKRVVGDDYEKKYKSMIVAD